MLKYGQHVERLAALSQERQVLDAYTQYSLFAHTLLYELLRLWVQRAGADARRELALPGQEELMRILAGRGGQGQGQRGQRGQGQGGEGQAQAQRGDRKQ